MLPEYIDLVVGYVVITKRIIVLWIVLIGVIIASMEGYPDWDNWVGDCP
jgi:hypothetical protein